MKIKTGTSELLRKGCTILSRRVQVRHMVQGFIRGEIQCHLSFSKDIKYSERTVYSWTKLGFINIWNDKDLEQSKHVAEGYSIYCCDLFSKASESILSVCGGIAYLCHKFESIVGGRRSNSTVPGNEYDPAK